MVEITERILNDAGGWQAMKRARSLVAAGRVLEANYDPPLLRGLVREGDTEYRSGLKIRTRTDIENICRCRESQRLGAVCAHSLAVGLQLIRPPKIEPSTPAPEPVPKDGLTLSASGQPLNLQVILPPNFDAAWARGQIAIAIEAETAGRRMPPEKLPLHQSWNAAAHDIAVIDSVRKLNNGRFAGMLILDRDSCAGLLSAAIGHPCVTVGKNRPLTLGIIRPRLTLKDGAEATVDLPPHDAILETAHSFWLRSGDTLIEVAPGLPAAYRPLLKGPVILDADAAEAFKTTELPRLVEFFHIPDLPRIVPDAIEPERPGFHLAIEGSLNHLSAHLAALYPGRRIPLGQAGAPLASRRNEAAEQRALERLQQAGFSAPDNRGQMTLRTERLILRFFANVLPRIQSDWEVEIGSRFRNVTSEIDRAQPEVMVKGSGEDWFTMDFQIATSGGQTLSPSEVQRLLRGGQSHFRGKNGRLTVLNTDLLEDFEEVLRDCQPEQLKPGSYRVDNRAAGYLGAVFEGQPEFRVRGDPLQPPPEDVELEAFAESLRPYQRDGVRWLHVAARQLGGGILADEMGLGKTAQALTLLRLRRLQGATRPFLVVAPASLLFNWVREARQFAPDITTEAIEGSNRAAALQKVASSDLIVTSYPLLQRDLAHYERVAFDTVILDEAQHIKNPETRNAKSAAALRSDCRIVLTGTPVENSVRDLWSIMNFVAPGYLGNREDFKTRYETPLRTSRDSAIMTRLKRRIRPFLLRRLKRDVITELPEKTMQVAYCSLSAFQAEVYKELVLSGREHIHGLSSRGAAPQARFAALNLLLRLRQVCCDPALVAPTPDPPAARSGKVDAFMELLEEVIDGGHRALVFSQFVSVLSVLRACLDSRDIPYCYLDGSTRDRSAQIDRFQDSGEIPVFLISLKAGGTGLNLTKADTVIHFDPWWNPAVEDQATDRAHRIGQAKAVTSYKLITRNTVEEKILELQARKRAMIDAVVESEEPLMTGLTTEDLQQLFE